MTASPQSKPRKKRKVNRIVFIILCTLPMFLLYCIFKLYPLADMAYWSFFDLKGIFDTGSYIGFGQYKVLFKSDEFWKALFNTGFYILFSTLFTIVLALVFATMLSKSKIKAKSFFRVIFYFPNILSVVVIAGMFVGLFGTRGVVNSILRSGQSPIPFLSSGSVARWTILIAMVWQGFGYYMVMYIAGMDSIPDSLYESARIDGANAVVQFFKITIPILWEVIRVTLSFFIISTINMSFLFVDTILTAETPFADNLLNLALKSRGSAYSYSMALSTVLFILTFVIAMVIKKVTQREVIEAQ